MYKKVRYHRTHLYPYDLRNSLFWNLPAIISNLSPLPPQPPRGKPPIRKIYLIPLIIPISPPAS
jgi:hypothetical protein